MIVSHRPHGLKSFLEPYFIFMLDQNRSRWEISITRTFMDMDLFTLHNCKTVKQTPVSFTVLQIRSFAMEACTDANMYIVACSFSCCEHRAAESSQTSTLSLVPITFHSPSSHFVLHETNLCLPRSSDRVPKRTARPEARSNAFGPGLLSPRKNSSDCSSEEQVNAAKTSKLQHQCWVQPRLS